MQNAPLGAFCNTFYLHKAIIGLENQFLVFSLSDRFYCNLKEVNNKMKSMQPEQMCRLICTFAVPFKIRFSHDMTKFINFLLQFNLKGMTSADPEGGGPDPENNHKNKGFLGNTGLVPLKNH